MYNWNGIKYPTVIANNNYALFQRKYLQIALVVLYVGVDVKILLAQDSLNAYIHKSIIYI